MICRICGEDHEENRCTKAPPCPKCGDNRQVWLNQINGELICHRAFCHTVIPFFGLRHDFPEDAGLENGSYACRCVVCRIEFVGHKRRVICKACSTIVKSQTFDEWLRTVCFQAPTPEAEDLARLAWIEGFKQAKTAHTNVEKEKP